jgi:anti-sigma regulatory factor (Ser/Thr protein kinase)
MKTFALQLDDDTTSVRCARGALLAWLEGTACSADCRHGIELVVSELVTNALVHGRSAPEIRAAVHRDRLHLEVLDGQPDPPRLRAPQGELGGFGLNIVDAVVLDWGWRPAPDGKVVWADVAL